jgi:hypothetical protein
MTLHEPLIMGKFEEYISEEGSSSLLDEISCLLKKIMRFNNWTIEEILKLKGSLVKYTKNYKKSTDFLKDVYTLLMN